MCICVGQCEPWSGVNLLDWDLEVLRPPAFPSPEVGLLMRGRKSAELCCWVDAVLVDVHVKSILLFVRLPVSYPLLISSCIHE